MFFCFVLFFSFNKHYFKYLMKIEFNLRILIIFIFYYDQRNDFKKYLNIRFANSFN